MDFLGIMDTVCQKVIQMVHLSSVTRFGDLENIYKSLGNLLEGVFSIWHTIIPTWAFYAFATQQIVML